MPRTESEPILAHRAWRLSESGLVSCTTDFVWPQRAGVRAACNRSGHDACPIWECECGYYAYASERDLARSEYLRMWEGYTVAGLVALWGRVIRHRYGYRAEFAYPQVLYLRGNKRDALVRRLAARYAVDCVPRR